MKEEILEYFKDINFAYNDCTRFDTLKRMLDALEQEPCEDAISKDAILDYVFHCKASLYDDIKEILDNIPSATPTRTL